MKKIIGYLTAAAIGLALVGCESKDDSSSDSTMAETTDAAVTTAATAATTIASTTATTTTAVTTTAKKTTTTEKKTQPPAETVTEAETEAIQEEEAEEPVNSGGYFSASDVYAYYGGYSLTVNQDAATLPAAQSVDASPSCYYEGDDKIFHYGDMDVYTYPVGDVDYVLEISLLSANASTARGLTVGMTLDDAIAMYGTGTDGGGMYTWYSGATYMYVTTSGGTITSIGLALSN